MRRELRLVLLAAIAMSTVPAGAPLLSDPVDLPAPALTEPTGPLWSDGYHHGTEPLTLTATDNSGIRRTTILVDGIARSTRERDCDFTLLVPCTNETGATHLINDLTIWRDTRAGVEMELDHQHSLHLSRNLDLCNARGRRSSSNSRILLVRLYLRPAVGLDKSGRSEKRLRQGACVRVASTPRPCRRHRSPNAPTSALISLDAQT